MSALDARLVSRTILVTAVRIFYLGLWFVAITAAYRHLGALPGGTAQAGLLAFALASIKMVTTAFGDPLDLDVVRRVPPVLTTDPALAAQIWRAAQQIRIGLAVSVALLATLIAVPVSESILSDRSWEAAIVLAGAAAALELLFRGYLADYQSRERFDKLLVLEGALQGIRVVSVGAMLIWGNLTAENFLLAYSAASLVSCLIAYADSDSARRNLWTFSAETSLATWRYVRWIAPAMILSAVVERLDILMLTSLRGPTESGLYGALLPLLLAPEMVIGFAMVVLQPRVADLHAKGTLFGFWMSICCITVPLAIVGGLIAIFFADTIIALTIGPAYLQSVAVLRLLLIAVTVWFAVVPVALSFVVMTQPRATLMICIVQAVIMGSCGAFLIPAHGAFGAALAVLVMRLTTGAIVCGIAYLQLRPQALGERVETK